MKKITGKEFKDLIEKDPSWCKDLKEPLKITGFTRLDYSNITHLSPLITFSKDDMGWAASFYGCKNLKVATGTFNGFLQLKESGIEKIENLTVKGVECSGWSANFSDCENLKVATGTFTGSVKFSKTKVETIKDLIIKKENNKGVKANFLDCPIKYVPREYRGKKFIFNEKIIENSIKKDTRNKTINKIKSETNNIEL